ncbi:unnamed protein product [Prorocentrum cordatum]|uniref:Pseudouridine synthase RsuA/RluA-like domain-containing protein n=1 Tax=Prorocentrum cordatum TaxID=2364126 RepID=A0ABN9RWA0_9DINO|nr:unnamed protein product [Polarella glacialis]
MVGRLDGDSEGLLVTSDGTFTRFLCEKEVRLEKEYVALVHCPDGAPPQEELMRRLCEGVDIADGQATAVAAEVVDFDGRFARMRIVVTEGRFHMVRRMVRAIGYRCLQLFRTHVGGISGAELGPRSLQAAAREAWHPEPPLIAPAVRGDPRSLRPGEYADVSPEEVAHVYRLGLGWLDAKVPVAGRR